jgi:hypothetical protein
MSLLLGISFRHQTPALERAAWRRRLQATLGSKICRDKISRCFADIAAVGRAVEVPSEALAQHNAGKNGVFIAS